MGTYPRPWPRSAFCVRPGADCGTHVAALQVAEKKSVAVAEIELSCAQTNKVYADDRTAIPRNSILNFKKVPIKAAPVGAPGGRSMNRAPSKAAAPAAPAVPLSQQAAPVAGVGTFDAPSAPGGLAYPEAPVSFRAPTSVSMTGQPASGQSEDDKIANLHALPSAAPAEQQPRTGGPASFGNIAPGGGAPYPGYICKRCQQTGHYIKFCPTNGDSNFDRRPVPHGIPLSTLRDADMNDPEDAKRAMRAADGTFKV